MKKINTQIFIERAEKIHGSFYDYSKVQYNNMKEKICIICPTHGEFYQSPDSHLRGSGCSKCSGKLISNTQEFINKASEMHNNKYIYDKVTYTTAKSKVK